MGNECSLEQLTTSVLRHLRIDALRPSRNPARQITNFGEAGLLQERNCFRAASAHLAMGHDLAARVEFAHSLWKIAEPNEIPLHVADLVFVRFAHVENKDVGLSV